MTWESEDRVFRALAEPLRRDLLGRLRAENGQALGTLCDGLGVSRQAASKHLAVLEGADLIVSVRRGREKAHYLNPIAFEELADHWLAPFERVRVRALVDLQRALASEPE